MNEITNRETWLLAAIEQMRPIFAEVGETIPAVKVSVGWPGGSSSRKNSVIGQCWHKNAAADEIAQIFVSPVLDDASRVLDVLAHELVHAIDENESGHKGNFARIAKGIGLEGKMTATVAGEALKARLDEIVAEIGSYPHARLVAPGERPATPIPGPGWRVPGPADGPKKQGTRMLKVVCATPENTEEVYVVRMTRKWLDTLGTPLCPCHREPMLEVAA